MNKYAYEVRLNVALARLLRRLGFEEIAERRSRRKRIDIMIFYKGLRIALEGSYDARDAEKDARKRVESNFADLGLAIWYDKEFFPETLSEEEIEKRLERTPLRIKVMAPGEDVTGTLMPFVQKVTKPRPRQMVSGWLEVDIPLLRQCIDHAISFFISERKILKLQDELEHFIDDFVGVFTSIDTKMLVCKELYDIFYRLYGLSVGNYKKIRELIYSQTALALILSAVFYEGVANKHNLKSLQMLKNTEGSARSALATAFKLIWRVDYKPIYNLALEVLPKLPPAIEPALQRLIDLSCKIADNRALLRRDFAGKVYHTIVGDWAIRKGFATYFTSIPAAYLVSSIALLTPNGHWKADWSDLNSLKHFHICDFAQGTGTLLSASCEALQYLYIKNVFMNDKEADVASFHRTLMENSIWGFDALRYATHITATTLALRNPDVTLNNMNLYTVPLGVNTNNKDGRVSLGSLEFLGKSVPTTILEHIYQGKGKIGIKTSMTEEVEATPRIPKNFNFIVMNPPFTRATGRGKKGEKQEKGLFGFIPDPKIRKDILKTYKRVRNSIRSQLKTIAKHFGIKKSILPALSSEKGKMNPFLSIGQAGEGALFLYLAYEYVEVGGRIAFVLPKNLLSGISWFLLRSLLASRFHLEYIILSFDPEGGYNFSESTSLSEVLIVAKRVNKHKPSEKTCLLCLLKKPKTAMEAVQLAHEVVRKYSKEAEALDVLEHGYGVRNMVSSDALMYTVSRQILLENVDNWGKIIPFTDPWLSTETLTLLSGKMSLGEVQVNIPLKRLGKIARIGIDRRQFHDHFTVVDSNIPGSLPSVYGGKEEIRSNLSIDPNAYILPKDAKGRRLFQEFSSSLLIPDRIRFNTTHVISLYASVPVMSNIFYSVRFRTKHLEAKAKALSLWLNTTWGLLTVLASREETEGAWMSLKMGHWRLLPVLDVTSLSKEKLRKLAELFDRYKDVKLKRLIEQYGPNVQDERLQLDVEFLKILNPEVNRRKIDEFLKKELYPRLYQALKQWTG